MTDLHDIRYPNESAEYRERRNTLLQAELDLRERIEPVGQAAHITQRANLAVVASSPPDRLRTWAERRGWGNLRMRQALDLTPKDVRAGCRRCSARNELEDTRPPAAQRVSSRRKIYRSRLRQPPPAATKRALECR